MITFYDLLVSLSERHVKLKGGGFTDGLHFDQTRHRITVGKHVLYDNGIIEQIIQLKDGTEIPIGDMKLIDSVESPYEVLEQKYRDFRHSIATPYSNFLKCNFRALENDKIESGFADEKKREIARTELEAFVMFTKFTWKNERHHYWQSENQKSLILRKEWSV